jgi:hypothetical protein
MATFTWLLSDQITGGSAVDLLATKVTGQFNAHISKNDIPGKDVTESFANKLHEIDHFGIINPRYTIEGQFDKSKATSVGGSVCISMPIVGSHQRLGSPVWFYDDGLILSSAGSCEVVFETFKANKSATTGSTINYNMTLIQTKAW